MNDPVPQRNPSIPGDWTALLREQPDLAKALAEAQARCTSVEKDAFNSYHKYKYASANAILAVGKQALTGSGLSLLPLAPQLIVLGSGTMAIPGLEQGFLLTHASGQCIPLGLVKWPVVPGKGKELDKAFSGALTSAHAYLLRGLLGIPAAEPGEEISAREDRTETAPPTPTSAAEASRPMPTPPPATSETRISEEQNHTLAHLIRETKTDVGKLLGHYGLKALAQLPAARFAECETILRAKLPTDQTPPLPAVSSEQAARLSRFLATQKAPLADWLELLGVASLEQMPAAWVTWFGLQVEAQADPHELAQAMQVKTLRDLPAERWEPITRAVLIDRIDKIDQQLGGFLTAEWLTGLFGQGDPNSLTTEQLIQVKKRLADRLTKKGASKPAA